MIPRRRQRGMSPAVEAVLIVPVIVVLLGVMTAGFRLWHGRSEVNHLAGAAARAATQARSADEAHQRVMAVVHSNQLPCQDPVVRADLQGFASPLGTRADVAVTITCRIAFTDLVIPGMPGSRQVSATATAPLDPYRKRNR